MTDPDQIRAEIDAVLAELPSVDLSSDVFPGHDPAGSDSADNGLAVLDLDILERRLDQAHQVLVRALESVEKG